MTIPTEELPDGFDLSLTAVRALPVEKKNLYIIGGKKMDKRFLASLVLPAGMRALLYRNLEPNFSAAQLVDSNDTLQNPERLEPLINEIHKSAKPIIKTVDPQVAHLARAQWPAGPLLFDERIRDDAPSDSRTSHHRSQNRSARQRGGRGA